MQQMLLQVIQILKDTNYIKHKEPELYEKFEQYYKDLKKKTKYCKECGVKFSAAEKFCNFCLTKKPEPKITEDRADTHLFALVREILHWEDMDIDFMYKRTMFLSDKLFKDVLFTQTDAGKIFNQNWIATPGKSAAFLADSVGQAYALMTTSGSTNVENLGGVAVKLDNSTVGFVIYHEPTNGDNFTMQDLSASSNLRSISSTAVDNLTLSY